MWRGVWSDGYSYYYFSESIGNPIVQLRHPQHSDQPTGPTITPAVRAAPSQTLVAHWEHAIP
jgi:hypothetical protein